MQEKDDFQKIHDIIVANPGNIELMVEYKNCDIQTPLKVTSDKTVLEELEKSCLMRRVYGD